MRFFRAIGIVTICAAFIGYVEIVCFTEHICKKIKGKKMLKKMLGIIWGAIRGKVFHVDLIDLGIVKRHKYRTHSQMETVAFMATPEEREEIDKIKDEQVEEYLKIKGIHKDAKRY